MTKMKLPIYQVDAFADQVFSGNPAAVCPLPAWLSAGAMQQIAAENNLSETAFFVGTNGDYELRWFTPTSEVDLCGHATLASAFVISTLLEPGVSEMAFRTRGGILTVERTGGSLELGLPMHVPEVVDPPALLAEALGVQPSEVLAARNYLVILGAEAEVRAVRPDFRALKDLPLGGVIISAPGDTVDFVSRYFAPKYGIDEDPVTGSAHCELTPYWSRLTGRPSLRAQQVSARGGMLHCKVSGERVLLSGNCALYLTGEIKVGEA